MSEDGILYGLVHQEHFEFPFILHRADPNCLYRDGKYYFIATNNFDGNKSLSVRCADTLTDIGNAEEALLLDVNMYPDIKDALWTPEFHEINGKLYIFFAATGGEFFREAARVMKLRNGGNIMNRDDWEALLVVRKDGTTLCNMGKVISLDMSPFEYEGNWYAMWSQRQFLPEDQWAWLYLAQIDSKEPWKLISDPICIAKPDYGWENNHTFVVEGPYAIWNHGKLMITYSGALVDSTYTVGILKLRMGSDILDPVNWEKGNYPLMSSRSCPDEDGAGHNSYVKDTNSLMWNFYHGRKNLTGPRSSGARRVHFDIDDESMLDVLEAFDLPEEMRTIAVKK